MHCKYFGMLMNKLKLSHKCDNAVASIVVWYHLYRRENIETELLQMSPTLVSNALLTQKEY